MALSWSARNSRGNADGISAEFSRSDGEIFTLLNRRGTSVFARLAAQTVMPPRWATMMTGAGQNRRMILKKLRRLLAWLQGCTCVVRWGQVLP